MGAKSEEKEGAPILGLPCASPDLREQEINAERRCLVVQEALKLCDLLLQHLRRITNTANNAQTTGVRHRRRKLRAGRDVHAGEHDGVVDLQEIGNGRADLLYCFARPTGVSLTVATAQTRRKGRLIGAATYEATPSLMQRKEQRVSSNESLAFEDAESFLQVARRCLACGQEETTEGACGR